MDLLADVLSVMQFSGTVYCQTDFTAPWGVHWEKRTGHAGFFMVMRGGCYLESSAFAEPIPLRAGDFVMSPKALGYILRDSLQSKVERFDDIAAPQTVSSHRIVHHGGGGCSTHLLMGCFKLDETSNNPFVKSLPDFILVRAEEMQTVPWLEQTLKFLAFECTNESLGSSILIRMLTEQMFIQAVRFYVARDCHDPEQSHWLKGASDPQIGKALSCMHETPSAPWTVADLAIQVGMSRSAFALKFKELTNTTPLDYLTSWRMQKAARLIAEGDTNLAEIANLVGYQSEAAFSKAFKREKGMVPSAMRQRAR
jgi:AraC family transcriptional regulator, alkane utilization regulator